jgi:hypothetical protein
MAITKLQANWNPVSFSGNPITMVTNVGIDQGGQVDTFKADADLYDVVAARLTSRPTCSITSGDEATMMALSGNGIIVATHNDALKATGGGVVYTITTAAFENCSASGAHAEFGSSTATFKTFTADGITNPIAITRV